MKIFAALISHDVDLCELFTKLLSKAFPPDAFKRSVYAGRHVDVSTLGIPSSLDACIIARKLIGGSRNSDCFLLFVDDGCQGIIERLKSTPLITDFRSAEIGNSPRNFINALSGRALRSFATIWANKDDDICRLPVRNFDAPELRDLLECCRTHSNAGDFNGAFGVLLRKLRDRERPRRRSSYKNRYAVDTQGKFFIYGKENHARFDTGAPHDGYCELQARFRFGSKVDERRHFNVSEGEGDDTSITGHFPSCHNDTKYSPVTSHLNMFCNDFF